MKTFRSMMQSLMLSTRPSFRLTRKPPVLGMLGLAGVLTLVFQNCSQPMLPTESNSASEADQLDFAYDAKINQIAYMTCSNLSGDTFDKSAYFTFRVGAYDNKSILKLLTDNGGVKLTDEFLSSVARFKPEKQMTLLASGKANNATIMQVSVRPKGALQSLMTSSGSPKADSDYQNILDTLGSTDISSQLLSLKEGSRLRYVRTGAVHGGRMEGSLLFGGSADTLASLRGGLSTSDNILTLTFTERSGTSVSDTDARSPAHLEEKSPVNPSTNVFGRGYELGFETIGAGSITGGHFQTVYLASVSEKNLNNPSDREGTWSCPQTLKFKIIREEDAGDAASRCAMNPDPAPQSMSNDLKLARNSLRTEDWWIDMGRKCIVSKKTALKGCYGDNTYIQYDPTKACNHSPATNNAIESNRACAAYASICVRTN